MIYEWDEAKNQANIKKHGIAFEEAQTVFDDPGLQIAEDDGPWKERRFRAIGWSKETRQLFVVYCERGEEEEGEEIIRIVSARKLTRKEQGRLGRL